MKMHDKLETIPWLRVTLISLLASVYWTVAGAANPEPAGWYAGDMHVHRSCGGPPEAVTSLYNKMATNNLAVISLLADMGNGEVQNPITDLPLVNGSDAPVSTQGRIVHWDTEWHWDAIYTQFPHQALGGHLVALGLNEAHQIWEEYTYPIMQWAQSVPNDGIAGFAHMQYLDEGIPQTLNCCIPIEYPVEVALGAADFISEDVTGSDTAIHAYYRLLNTGFRPGFAAGTDYPCGVSELGSLLTYVKVANGQMTYSNWIEGIKAGRTVVSRNAHNEFLNLRVNGTAAPGDEIPLSAGASLPVTVTWTANKNLSGTIELIKNGVVVASKLASVTATASANLSATVNFTKSGWLAARRMDIKGHQSHTSAVFVTVNNAPVRASAEDAQFYEQWMDELLTKTSPGGVWNAFFPTNLVAAQARYLDAKAIYHQIALEAGATPRPLTIVTTGLPNGILGFPYSATLSASGGTSPYSWSVSGLPAGLSVVDGTIAGTPLAAGFNSFSVQASDAGNPIQTASRQLNLTINSVPPASSTLWPATALPSVAADDDASPVELGVKFRSGVNGFITGIRFYKGSTNTGAHVGNLWDSSGNLLASAAFTNETASGWQRVSFPSPVAIAANTVYVASYHTNTGHYSVDSGYFANSGIANGLLYALRDGENGGNGVFAYGATSSFPNATYQASNYWVDAVFTASIDDDTTPPTVPANVKAAATSVTQVNLKWTASTDNIAVTRYVVERCQGASCGGGSFAQIASPVVNNFADSGLAPETTYRYRVKAVDPSGNQSGYSAIATAATNVIATPDTFLFKSGMLRTVDYAGPLGLGVLANDADSKNLLLNSVLLGVIPPGVTLENTGIVTINRATGASFKYRASNGTLLSLPATGAAVILRLNGLPKAVIDNCTYNRAGTGSIVSGSACVMAASARVFSMNLRANDTDPNITINKPSDGVGDAITGAIITATGTGVSVAANPVCGQAAIGTSTASARITNRCNGVLTVTVTATAPATPIKFNYKAVDDLKGESAAVINTITVQ